VKLYAEGECDEFWAESYFDDHMWRIQIRDKEDGEVLGQCFFPIEEPIYHGKPTAHDIEKMVRALDPLLNEIRQKVA
jgi:hypothetical protein